MMIRTTLFAVAAVASALALPRAAHAQSQSASCEVSEIAATQGTTLSIAPALKDLSKKLKKPPFSSWKTFKLLKKHTNQLSLMTALNIKLSSGRKLSLLYRSRHQRKNRRIRLRFTFALDDKKGRRTVDGAITMESGQYSLIGGDRLPNKGTYILAISCTAN